MHWHGKGILTVELPLMMCFGDVVGGRLLTPRRVLRFLTWKSDWMWEIVVVLGDM